METEFRYQEVSLVVPEAAFNNKGLMHYTAVVGIFSKSPNPLIILLVPTVGVEPTCPSRGEGF